MADSLTRNSVFLVAVPHMAELIPLSCIIVEDNEMNRLTLAHFVEITPGLTLAAALPDGLAAPRHLQTEEPADVLLLDIEMPHFSGLELIRVLPQPLPAVVLVTSHQDFAVEAFGLPVTDYLLKPVEYARFLQAVQRVRDRQPTPAAAPLPAATVELPVPGDTELFVKVNGRLVRLDFNEMLYIEALSTYSVLVTATQKHIVYSHAQKPGRAAVRRADACAFPASTPLLYGQHPAHRRRGRAHPGARPLLRARGQILRNGLAGPPAHPVEVVSYC